MGLTPEQCRAARALLNWTQDRLASLAGVSRSTVRDFEGRRHRLRRATEALLAGTLQDAGVRLLPSGCEGLGVRLSRAGEQDRTGRRLPAAPRR